nr:type III pantothenate kinase [Salipaludibacillus agaradhaerens]
MGGCSVNLVMDVGNTKIALGVYEEEEEEEELLSHWTIETNVGKTTDEYIALFHQLFQLRGLDASEVHDILISSVVPQLDQRLILVCQSYFNLTPMFVGPGIKTGLNILYDNPKEVGSDRIANAVAGIAYYGAPLIIIDFGTATTFCYITKNNQYAGGAIAPGMSISMNALSQHAAKLPGIDTFKAPNVIAKNTVHAMQSGFLYGMVGQVEGMVSRIKEEMGADLKVIATGELAALVKKETTAITIVDEWLTLKGLQLIYRKNRNT